jgi:hypothetical protein
MAFKAHTPPAVNIPSKNKLMNQIVLKYCVDILPKNNDIKKPTHVLVHKVHEIRSPKNLDLLLIHVLVDSNIDPHTNIEVIPYAAIM